MENDHIRTILNNIENGTLTASEAYAQLKLAPFEDLGYAKVDHHREVRQGAPEVIYGASKTKEQIEGITNSLLAHCPENILITRLSPESAAYLSERFTLFYDEASRIGIVNRTPHITAEGTIVVATGGTSDIPVAEEAALTAEVLGNKVVRVYDVGVAGLHRLLSHIVMSGSPPPMPSSLSQAWRAHSPASSEGSWTALSSAFPQVWDTVPAFTASPHCSPCSIPVPAACRSSTSTTASALATLQA